MSEKPPLPVAVARCPLCGSTENDIDGGGNERCFHCECGWAQCADKAEIAKRDEVIAHFQPRWGP